MKKTNKKGFTIVELVIVIAVIGILSAILIPTFTGLTAEAQRKALQANLRGGYVAYLEDTGAQEADVVLADGKITALGVADTDIPANITVYVLGDDGVWVAKTGNQISGTWAKATEDADKTYNGFYIYTVEVA